MWRWVFQIIKLAILAPSHDPTLPKINMNRTWFSGDFPSSESPEKPGGSRNLKESSGFVFGWGRITNRSVPGHSFEASWNALDLQFPAASTKDLGQPAMKSNPQDLMKNIYLPLVCLDHEIWRMMDRMYVYGKYSVRMLLLLSLIMGMDNARWWWIMIHNNRECKSIYGVTEFIENYLPLPQAPKVSSNFIPTACTHALMCSAAKLVLR